MRGTSHRSKPMGAIRGRVPGGQGSCLYLSDGALGAAAHRQGDSSSVVVLADGGYPANPTLILIKDLGWTYVFAMPRTRKFSRRQELEEILAEIQKDYLPPIYVKPATEEGSFGIERIDNPSELRAAAARILRFEDLIVQEHIPGTEFSLSVAQDGRGRARALPPTAIVPQRAAFYDHLAKRRSGRVAMHTVQDTTNPIIRSLQESACDIYDELGCQGIVAVDMVANGDDITVLEVNTVPTASAFTPLNQQLQAAGLHPAHVLEATIRQSIEQGAA
jgi:D-alanine-D-alanine ligase-like ATP-grasp enzyme